MEKIQNLQIPVGDCSNYHLQKREVSKRTYKDLHGYDDFHPDTQMDRFAM
jgi:hypothetical protein